MPKRLRHALYSLKDVDEERMDIDVTDIDVMKITPISYDKYANVWRNVEIQLTTFLITNTLAHGQTSRR